MGESTCVVAPKDGVKRLVEDEWEVPGSPFTNGVLRKGQFNRRIRLSKEGYNTVRHVPGKGTQRTKHHTTIDGK